MITKILIKKSTKSDPEVKTDKIPTLSTVTSNNLGLNRKIVTFGLHLFFKLSLMPLINGTHKK